MKYKWLFVVVLFIFNGYVQAQMGTIDLDENVKYMIDSPTLFLVKKRDSLYVIRYRKKFNMSESAYETNLSTKKVMYSNMKEIEKANQKVEKDFIKISDLNDSGQETILTDLKQKQFSFQKNKLNVILNVIDNEYVMIRNYETNNIDGTVLTGSYFVKLYPLLINKKYSSFIIENINKPRANSPIGHIIALKNKYIIDYLGNNLFTSEIMSKKDSSDVRKVIGLYPEGDFFNENSKYGLKSKSGNQILIPPVYDSIYYYEQFVAGKKGNLLQVHYKNGEPLNIPNIRAIILDKGNYGVLVNNKTYWLDNGAIVDVLPIKPIEPICGSVPDVVHSIVKEKDNFKYYYVRNDGEGVNDGGEVILCPSNALKEVAFLNQKTENKNGNYHYFSNSPLSNCYIVETLKNNKSIAQITYGKIEYLLKPDKYTFTFIDKEHMQFEVRGMYGLYPFDKKAKYNNLSGFEKGFARFELPNGQKGWVDLEGNEYLDH